MFGLIIIAVIVFAVIQHRKHQRVRWSKWNARDWQKWGDDWQKWGNDWKKWGDDWKNWSSSDWQCKNASASVMPSSPSSSSGDTSGAPHSSTDSAGAKLRGGARYAERYAREFESKMARKFESKAERFERRLRRKFDKQTQKYGGHSADPIADTPPPPQFKNDAEREAYNRARKRAAMEAGFYVHLMWYGVVIGFLFIINLATGGFGGYPWFLWPALGWGFGVASHFSAVYGWRWIQSRVFEPAIQREVQREVMQEKEQLRTEKQASLDELTATFAHEIRNPIAAAKSLVQQMGEDPTSHENVEYAKVALDELARVERSVSHLLKYAKEEDYKFEDVNLASVLDGALTQMRSKLEAKSVAVSRAYLSGPMVRADADKLRQVFSNVIDNAIDAMEANTAERKLELAIQNNGTGMAAVTIRDNGCGIAEDKLGKIFNPFYTSKSTGTGLGLGVARKVIDSHRGVIQVHSKVGAGTEFEIAIPLSDAMRDADAEGAEADAETVDAESAAPAASIPAPQSAPASVATAPAPQAVVGNSNGHVDPSVAVAMSAASTETSRTRN